MDDFYIRCKPLSNDITFSNNTSYYNFSTLSTLADYNEHKNAYLFFKLKSVSFEICRVVDETTMLDSTSGSIWLLYFPTAQNFTPSVSEVKRNQVSYKIDLMTFDKQTIICPISSIQTFVQTGADYVTVNSAIPLETINAQHLKGQFTVVSDNTNTNPNILNLFSVTVKYQVEFYFRD
jgi:hypothetical protein